MCHYEQYNDYEEFDSFGGGVGRMRLSIKLIRKNGLKEIFLIQCLIILRC